MVMMSEWLPYAARVERAKAFYARRNDRPLLGFFTDDEYPLRRYPRGAATLPAGRPLRPEDLRPDAFLEDGDRLHERHEACGGDLIWSADAFWGVPWLEAALGCPIIADPATGSIHAEARPGFRGAADLPEFDPAAPWCAKIVEFLAVTARHAGGRYPLGTTRMRGVADLLATLYGGEGMVMAMLEQPEEVAAVCAKLTDFWIAFARLQLAHIPLFHGGVGSFYYSLWAPPGTVWHQEDSATLLSPDLFAQFIRPCDARVVAALPQVILHMHPARFLPVADWLELGFATLELHVDEGGPGAPELYDTHRRILERSPLLIWGRLSDRDLDWIFSRLPPRGLAVNAVVAGPDEARRIRERYGSPA